MRIIYLLVGTLSFGCLAFAEPSLNLQEAIQEAVTNSPSIKKHDAEIAVAEAKVGESFSGLIPKAGLFAYHQFTLEDETYPVSLAGQNFSFTLPAPYTSYGVEAKWTVFDGLANWNHYSAAREMAAASRSDDSRAKFELERRVKIAFFRALAAQKFAEVAEANLKTISQNYERLKSRIKNGVATQYDILRVEVQLSEAKNEVERTKDDIAIERTKLNSIMGIEKGDSRALAGELPSPVLGEKMKLVAAPNPNEREDLVAIQHRLEAVRHESKAAFGELLPSVSLTARYEQYDNTDYSLSDDGAYRDAYSVGVLMKWNIFDGGYSLRKRQEAAAIAEQNRYAYEEHLNSLPADFQMWQRRYVYSANTYLSKKGDIERSEESVRIAHAAYQQGTKTIIEVLDADSDLFRARAGLVKSQLDAEEALVQLELVLGKELSHD